MYEEYYIKRLERKEYVNQLNEDEVLIYNMRRVVPICIPINIFNHTINNLSQEKSNLLIKMYSPQKIIGIDGNINNVAVLNTIFYQIESNEFEAILESQQLSIADKVFLTENYVKAGDYYILKRNYDDISDIKIARILKKEYKYSLFDDYYVKLSNIFEEAEQIEKTNIFRSGMFVNTLHPYFYRKCYEHIPGMMLLEASRQFGYAASYRYINVSMNEVVFALTELNSKFFNYMQSNFPVYIQGTYVTNDFNFKKLNRSIGYCVSFYQKETEDCRIDIYAKTIANKIFQRIREGFENDYSYRFVPGLKFQHSGYFINLNDKKKSTGKIKELSLNDFIIKFENDNNLFENNCYEFIFYIDNIGIIHGTAILIEKALDYDETVNTHFKIDHIDDSDKENLKETIKKYTYLLDESIKELLSV